MLSLIKYVNFFAHYVFATFFVWVSGYGIEYFTDFPKPSFGIHTLILMFIIVYAHRRFVSNGNVDLFNVPSQNGTNDDHSLRVRTIDVEEIFADRVDTDPHLTLSDTNPLD